MTKAHNSRARVRARRERALERRKLDLQSLQDRLAEHLEKEVPHDEIEAKGYMLFQRSLNDKIRKAKEDIANTEQKLRIKL